MSDDLKVKLYAAPAVEPVTLAEAKAHLGQDDSGSVADNSALNACIAAGSHPVVTAYSLVGTAVDVLGKQAIVYLQPVNNGASGTVDVKIQEADLAAGPFTDWTGGAFTQVTEATDTVIQEIAYTGAKQWIRTAAKTLVTACEFGTSVMVWQPNVSEDTMLSELLEAAREQVENDTGRKIVTQTWDYYPQEWPSGDRLKIPFGNLSSVTSVKWKDTDGTETTLTVTTDYLVETNGDQCGFLVLPYGGSWPSGTLYPSNPISIRFVCGYGLAASVPKKVKQAVKRCLTLMYQNRGDNVIGQTVTDDKTYDRIISAIPRLWDRDFL